MLMFTATHAHILQVVEIFMYGVMPAVGNGSWSGKVSNSSLIIIYVYSNMHRLINLPMTVSLVNFSMATLYLGIYELVLLVYFLCGHICSHGNTLWLDTIEERVKLKAVGVITPLISLKGQLLHLGLAEVNTEHLDELKQDTTDNVNNETIIKPR